MNSFKRVGLTAALAAALSLSSVLGALAQDSKCTLSADDCKIITTADSNMSKLTSFNDALEFVTDIKVGDQVNETAITGTGTYTSPDPAAADKLGATLDLSNVSKGGGNDGTTAVNVVVVNGVTYLSTDGKKTWKGYKTADLAAAMKSGAIVNNADLTTQAGVLGVISLLSDPSTMGKLSSIPTTLGFTKLEKTANAPTLDGQKQTEFLYTLDFKSVLGNSTLSSLFTSGIGASFGGGAGAAGGGDMTQMLGSLLKDPKVTLVRWVGSTDSLYHAIGLDVSTNLDMSALPGGGTGSIGITVHLLLKLTKVGEPVTVTAPAGAAMVDLAATPAVAPPAAATMAATAAG